MGTEINREEDPETSLDGDPAFDVLLRQVARLGRERADPPLPQPGQIIGDKYRIEQRIGRGGMGAVFRASHLLTHKPVAVKWMLRSAGDERARRRFLREAQVAGRIDHPNVVDVYDVVQDGECGYLVMELLHGESLRALLQRGPLPLGEVLALLLPAMRGVAAVHRAGVVHRDLKPDNIFLCRGPDGTPREAKVLDFGVSAIATKERTDTTLSQDGALLGTPAYMSPEQLQSAGEVDARSDVYAFGVILYEALSGQLPFVSAHYPSLLLAILNVEPTPLGQLCPQLPHELSSTVARALAKRREDRIATIDALIAALSPWDRALSVEPAAPLLPVRAQPGRAVPGRAASAGALLLIGLSAWLLLEHGGVLSRPAPAQHAAVPRTEERAVAAARAEVAGPTPSLNALPRADLSMSVDPAPLHAPLATAPRAVDQSSPERGGRAARAAGARRASLVHAHVPRPKQQRSGTISIDEL